MRSRKTEGNIPIALTFPRTGNPWIDAGVVGLFRMLSGEPSYVKVPPGSDTKLPGSPCYSGVKVALQGDALVVAGTAEEVQACLEEAYDRLVASCYDLSSKSQIEKKETHNFYYDRERDCFVSFPKKRAAGAALLLYDKQAVPAGDKIEWGADPRTGKRKPGVLPSSHAQLQPRLDAYLAAHSLKAGPESGMLVDAGNEVRPKMEFDVRAKVGKIPCFLTGAKLPGSAEAKGTTFPLFGGSRSFMNNTKENLRIGWQMDFVGKFVPALAFFYQQGADLHLFLPESNDFRRVNEMATRLQHMLALEPNLFRNFDLHLGGYFERRSEVALAFLHRVFERLTEEEKSKGGRPAEPDEQAIAEALYDEPDIPGNASEASITRDAEISSQAVYDATLRGGAVAFTVVSAVKKGNLWMARDFWTFHDVVYLSRLLESMLARKQLPSGKVRLACSPRSLMNSLVDFQAKEDKTLLRERVCDGILRRRSVLPLLERHAYRIFTEAEPNKPRPVTPLLDFAVLYEVQRYEETSMTKDDYEKMVKRATWLGNNIADGVVDGIRKGESSGQAKGVFFRLRKTRTTRDFLDEIARLQNRYTVTIPPESLDDPVIFNHDTFEEYRGFCIVAALSRYQWKTRSPAST